MRRGDLRDIRSGSLVYLRNGDEYWDDPLDPLITQWPGFVDLPGGIRGHRFLVLERFRKDEYEYSNSDILWICIISSRTNSRYDANNLLHAHIYGAEHQKEDDYIEAHKDCGENCGAYIFLSSGRMKKESYVDLSEIYEWPVAGFEATSERVRKCSLELARRLASDTIMDRMYKSRATTGQPEQFLRQARESKVEPGQLFWLPKVDGRWPYSCLGKTMSCSPMACVVSKVFDLKPAHMERQIEIFPILDGRTASASTESYKRVMDYAYTSKTLITAVGAQKLHHPDGQKDNDITFEDLHHNLVDSSLRRQYLVAFPPIWIKLSSLHNLPAVYTLGRVNVNPACFSALKNKRNVQMASLRERVRARNEIAKRIKLIQALAEQRDNVESALDDLHDLDNESLGNGLGVDAAKAVVVKLDAAFVSVKASFEKYTAALEAGKSEAEIQV